MNTGGAGPASLGPIRAELRYISMFEWSTMLGGIGGPQVTQKCVTAACFVLVICLQRHLWHKCHMHFRC